MERERISALYRPKRGDAVRCLSTDFFKKIEVGKVYVISDLHTNSYNEIFVYLVGIQNTIFSPEHFTPARATSSAPSVARERL